MKSITTVCLGLVLAFSLQAQEVNISKHNQKSKAMNSYLSIFEIPATDVPRAIQFYSKILDIQIEELNFPGMNMGLFPLENQQVVGVIMGGEDQTPGMTGVTVYLNAGPDLQVVLDRVEENGGKILVPKTPHADEVGFFALFLDTEGNRLGLHSEK